jgi:aquaporin Z
MPIRVSTEVTGFKQVKIVFRKNLRFYLQEALGLAIFMVSACFFGALIFSEKTFLHELLPGPVAKNLLMGVLMGATALFIFYSPWTAPSGSHINPAVTLTFLRLGRMCPYDAIFFIVFQFMGGTTAVAAMRYLMGHLLTDPPVNTAVTVPGPAGEAWAFAVEFAISFVTMSMVLFTSYLKRLKGFTRILSGVLVCCWVVFAGPISGFGMNPARSFSSALPSGTWTSFWIYLFVPIAGMLAAAEFFLFIRKKYFPSTLLLNKKTLLTAHN